ncbi:hypothetical protein [Frigoribacterium sp. CFBP 13712]|uniref:hypothetical protein n=1 Tax=Frigoribacterium sp. CFBP 13712 TaxID=2775309 RepID=UPI00177BCA29|nr:hypothetical protein [Frigoribacterium sp. CFBP 13712]MBD8704903.1 hypothetical protein [Frigoribacterium sp. CFBP 13712]
MLLTHTTAHTVPVSPVWGVLSAPPTRAPRVTRQAPNEVEIGFEQTLRYWGKKLPNRVIVDWDNLLDLVLDPHNPRHEPSVGRSRIIESLVSDHAVVPLARDIVDNGLSPLETFGGIRERGDIVILEGNRRLCALLLLHDPDLAPARVRPAFQKLAGTFDPGSTEIEVTLFPTRNEATKWIERKHQGALNGVGIREWGSLEKARHFGEKSQNALALSILDWALAEDMISAEQREKKVLTTVTRYLSNPTVREDGLQITTGRSAADFAFDGPKRVFKRRLQRFLDDLYAEVVTSRTSAKERKTYAKTVLVPLGEVEPNPENDAPTSTPADAEGDAPTEPDTSAGGGSPADDAVDSEERLTGSDSDSDSDDASGGEDEDDGGDDDANDGVAGEDEGEPAKNSPSNPSLRHQLYRDPDIFGVHDKQLLRVINELTKTGKARPLSTAMLSRVLIEGIMTRWAENVIGEPVRHGEKLHTLMTQVLDDVKGRAGKTGPLKLSKTERAALERLRTGATSTSYVYGAAYLGFVAHGYGFPVWDELASRWDEIEPILLLIARNCEGSAADLGLAKKS